MVAGIGSLPITANWAVSSLGSGSCDRQSCLLQLLGPEDDYDLATSVSVCCIVCVGLVVNDKVS